MVLLGVCGCGALVTPFGVVVGDAFVELGACSFAPVSRFVLRRDKARPPSTTRATAAMLTPITNGRFNRFAGPAVGPVVGPAASAGVSPPNTGGGGGGNGANGASTSVAAPTRGAHGICPPDCGAGLSGGGGGGRFDDQGAGGSGITQQHAMAERLRAGEANLAGCGDRELE
jgi:hypothetical protein